MAQLTGTSLVYGSGASQTAGGGKVIRYAYGEYCVRTSLSINNNHIFWQAVNLNRQRNDTDIHVKALMAGHNKYSYPYGGTFVELKDPSNNLYRSYTGSAYEPCREGGNQEIVMYVDYTFRDSAISNATGNWTIQFGYQSSNGSNNRWAEIWNPSNSDDGRGWQKCSTVFVEEIKYGD